MTGRAGSKVSAFWPFRGEPDLTPALGVLHEAGRSIYLPVLDGRNMAFGSWHPDVDMRANSFGIPEPQNSEICPAEDLDWVLMPMLAFAESGTRLGMGGGFYDRTFEFLLPPAETKTPVLVGVAYSLQEAPTLPADRWDVPLSFVITELGTREVRLSERDPTAN
jgi:5-formyltetrahydrofolate cyclo-ligase